MRIRKEDTIAVAIDIQTKLFPFINEHQSLEENTLKLIDGLNILGLPIIVTEQYPKGIGPTLPSLIDRLGSAYNPIEKLSFSCCGEPKFMDTIDNLHKKNILVFGIESHVCVLQTVIDLSESWLNPIVVADCISSRNPYDKKIALKRMQLEGATITTVESILFELTESSGTDIFRAVSKIVK